jgi:uncharacterized protein (DUF1501 family)
MTRRDALARGLVGVAGLGLAGYTGGVARAALPPARAKSVIQIWIEGGPSHIDTFDPKPDAGYDYLGPLDKPIATNVDGIQVGQLLPMLAQQADKYSIIRSMTHGVNAHETASYMVQTGREPTRLVYPCVGALVSQFKGYEQGYAGLVPPYVVLTKPQGRFSESGFLGPRHKPFATGGDPNLNPFVVEGIVAEGISDERQEIRRDLMHTVDGLGRAMSSHPVFQQADQLESEAYERMFGEAREIFDLTRETDEMREAYGRNTFGQSCLMARRLVEQGVPYITINSPGWDTHKAHFAEMNQKLPQMDRGMATLLQDLSDRGLLSSTIVWWGGEFGRTPKVSWEAPWNGGRQHHGACFSSVVAGGGFSGGHVVGASDDRAWEVRDRPVRPRDLALSIYELMGIDPNAPVKNPRGLDVAVLPPAKPGEDAPLREIM